MRLALVPVRHRREFIGQRLELSVQPPAQRLDRDAQVAIEAHRVHDVPAIQSVLGMFVLLALPERIAEKWRAERVAESPRTAEIIFRPRAAICRAAVLVA